MNPIPDPVFVHPSELTEGVNILGCFRAEVGIGEAARRLLVALEHSGTPRAVAVCDDIASRKAHPFTHTLDERAPHDVNVLCLNADQMVATARQTGPGLSEGRYTAGYWFWELEHFPPALHHAFEFVDEVWTATDFVATGIRAACQRPVFTVPLPLTVDNGDRRVSRASMGLPDRFMFLFMFDFFSVMERKNPIGLIDAFSRAFRPGAGPVLVIKTINGSARPALLERLRATAAERPDVLVIDEYYSSDQKNALLATCDCYVSLHRSEGLGLTMAEAMGMAKPVIATGYSGNLHFMTTENSYLVDYTTGRVPSGCDPYPVGSVWAQPNLDSAAELMRRVIGHPVEAARVGAVARTSIVRDHSVAVAAAAVGRRLTALRSGDGRNSLQRGPVRRLTG